MTSSPADNDVMKNENSLMEETPDSLEKEALENESGNSGKNSEKKNSEERSPGVGAEKTKNLKDEKAATPNSIKRQLSTSVLIFSTL